jgi:membrane protease subunit HflC
LVATVRSYIKSAALYGALALIAILSSCSVYYVVEPTEMAGVRRFGTVETKQPVGPGLHFKLPLVDQVDTLQTSISKLAIKDLRVYTIDNQSMTLDLSLTYQIPANAVFHLLYDVGRSGNVDIWGIVEPLVADRAMRVFSRQNTVEISSKRQELALAISKDVSAVLKQTFGVDLIDMQIIGITYSPAFVESVEAAVRAKNLAIQAENNVNRVRFEAEQAKAKAEGEAAAAVTQATAEKQAAILRAEGQARATELNGEAQAHAVQLIGAAVAANPGVISYETTQRWNGSVPNTVMGTGGPVPLLTLNQSSDQVRYNSVLKSYRRPVSLGGWG